MIELWPDGPTLRLIYFMETAMRRLLTLAVLLCLAIGGTPAWSAPAPQKTVHVKEYKKKDGTVVKAHDRKEPNSKAAPSPTSSASPTVHASTRCQNCDRDEHGRIVRSQDAKRAFMRATGYPKGRPGYVVDHIVPLACHGADLPSNMQWQTIADAKAKDAVERVGCR